MLAMLGLVMDPEVAPVGNSGSSGLSISEQSMSEVVSHQQVVAQNRRDAIRANDIQQKWANRGVLDDWVDSCQSKIEKSWAKPDAKFGYTKGMPTDVGALMHKAGQNGLVMMTAGIFGPDGTPSLDGDVMGTRFENAAKGFLQAFADAAYDGMGIKK
jgi:hypothetical protein